MAIQLDDVVPGEKIVIEIGILAATHTQPTCTLAQAHAHVCAPHTDEALGQHLSPGTVDGK